MIIRLDPESPLPPYDQLRARIDPRILVPIIVPEGTRQTRKHPRTAQNHLTAAVSRASLESGRAGDRQDTPCRWNRRPLGTANT